MTGHQGVRNRLQLLIPLRSRETFYRVVAGVLAALSGFGILDDNEALLWSQLAVGTVTALFAMLYATTTLRRALYALVGPIGALLMAYGIVNDIKWAIIAVAVGQVFGTTTAAAKVVELDHRGALLTVATPHQATAVRRQRDRRVKRAGA